MFAAFRLCAAQIKHPFSNLHADIARVIAFHECFAAFAHAVRADRVHRAFCLATVAAFGFFAGDTGFLGGRGGSSFARVGFVCFAIVRLVAVGLGVVCFAIVRFVAVCLGFVRFVAVGFLFGCAVCRVSLRIASQSERSREQRGQHIMNLHIFPL